MNQGQLKELTDRLDTLIERIDPMKDEMYIALRSYLEEHSSLLRQILDEVKGGKPATERAEYEAWVAKVSATTPAVKVPPEAVGPVTVETVQTLDSGNPSLATPAAGQAEAKAAATTKGKPSAKPISSWGG